ncbi:DUF2177 family protein [Hydrogenophaga sp. PML113]|uniref:DUF2177 family protein n=1 Tax=Hydrogenophaga sp. PML113 TaxID=1899350 RepID=UPI0009F5DDE9|nr:DUF2177 family protein [Hydrogenophaga sp. PML113]
MPHATSHAPAATASTAAAPAWRWPLAYALTALVFLALDAVWLSSMHTTLYQPAIGHLLSGTVDWTAAGLFYVLYITGLLVFAVAPALSSGRWGTALGRGALFGLLAYATYDLTNQATLRDWPWRVTLADLAWGAFVSGTASGLAARLTLATCRRARPASGR